jgi:hypothetical protein
MDQWDFLLTFLQYFCLGCVGSLVMGFKGEPK